MNLSKLVPEDVPLFVGLIRDLFPGLECPRVGYPDFRAAVEVALTEQGYDVLPAQVSFKVSYSNKVWEELTKPTLKFLRRLYRVTSENCKLILTYLLTPWCRILFEKLIVTQLIKKNPVFFKEPEGSSPC
jgi:hypothetical protein